MLVEDLEIACLLWKDEELVNRSVYGQVYFKYLNDKNYTVKQTVTSVKMNFITDQLTQ